MSFFPNAPPGKVNEDKISAHENTEEFWNNITFVADPDFDPQYLLKQVDYSLKSEVPKSMDFGVDDFEG